MRGFAASAVLCAIVVTSCGQDGGGDLPSESAATEEASRSLATDSTPVSPSQTEPERTPPAYASPPPVPDHWLDYQIPLGEFVFRYPPDWFLASAGTTFATLYTFDPAATTPRAGYGLPDESIKVEMSIHDAEGSSGCGASMEFDIDTREVIVKPGAAEWTLSGLPAWLWVYGPGEGMGGTSLIPSVSLLHDDKCVGIAGYYTQTEPDIETFLQIVASFHLQ